MAKRPIRYFTRHCLGEGCDKIEYHECHSQKEYAETEKRYQNRPYFCSRHQPSNMQPNSPERHITLTCGHADPIKYPEIQSEHYWSDGSGVVFGPGFNAYAKDFPFGAKIHIRITVELPNPTPDRRL